MATLTWFPGPKGEVWYMRHFDIGLVLAVAKNEHGPGWIGKYRPGTYMPFTTLPGEYPLEELKRILETTVALLLEDE